jgi:hypothetical protein
MIANSRFLRPMMAGGLSLLAASSAFAYDFNALDALSSQAEFKQVAEDLSATLAYKPMAPAEGLGIIGFDVSASLGATKVKSVELLKRATGSDKVPDSLPVATIRAEKGLPLDFDIGASYAVVPGTSIGALSGELKWAFVSGGLLTPSLATRVFYTQMTGLKDMHLRSMGADVSISKGFAMVTPYAGVGLVSSKASTANNEWASESYVQSRVFGGVNLNLGLLNLAAEADQTGKDATFGVKVGLRF